MNFVAGDTVSKDLDSLGTADGRAAGPALVGSIGADSDPTEEGADVEGPATETGSLLVSSLRKRLGDSAEGTLLSFETLGAGKMPSFVDDE